MEKKHLIYAEDLLYELMQYPGNRLSKRAVAICYETVIKEKEVSFFRHTWTRIKELLRDVPCKQ